MIATLASWRPRVQIPPRPPFLIDFLSSPRRLAGWTAGLMVWNRVEAFPAARGTFKSCQLFCRYKEPATVLNILKNKQSYMLSHKYQPVKCNHARLSTFQQSTFPPVVRKSGPLGLIVASMLGVIIWLVFILFFALYWSTHLSLFQDIVVFIVSLCITGLLIGMMWLILGTRKYRTWDWNQ